MPKRTQVVIRSSGIYHVGNGMVAGPGSAFLDDDQLLMLKSNKNAEFTIMQEMETQKPAVEQPKPVVSPIVVDSKSPAVLEPVTTPIQETIPTPVSKPVPGRKAKIKKL